MQARHWMIITGHSRGIGYALTQHSLAQGHAVLGMARHTREELVGIAHQHGSHLEQWIQDLSEGAEATARLQAWMASLHPSDIDHISLVNNAAMLTDLVPLHKLEPRALALSTRVGLETPMQLMQGFLATTESWVAQGWRGDRRILNISSGLGRRAMASSGPYCAVKAGLDLLTRCVALDQAASPNPTRMESIAPGVIATDMQVHLRAARPEDFPDHANFVAFHEQQQLATPEHTAARLFAHLHSERFGQDILTDLRAL